MIKKRHFPILFTATLLITLSILASACSAQRAPASETDFAGEAAPAGAAEKEDISRSQSSQGLAPEQAIERVVIKNAELSLVVDNPSQSMDAVTQMAEELGGYVVSANLFQKQLDNQVKVTQASVTIRVPAERLNEAIANIMALTEQVPLRKNIKSQDVTSEYVDLQSRLRNLENTEEQLTEIMDNANRTEDVLSVYNRLVEIREEIELVKGQIQYFEQSAALSSISVELVPNEAVQPLSIGGWEPAGVAKNAVQALINVMTFFVNALIWIAIVGLPVMLVIFLIFILPIILVIRLWRRRNRTKLVESPSPPAAE
jgi:hypothetical protein